ncbi:hypothetical protein [Chryseobacterium sp.]|uniref:hypothetical protein n=1 Tax=Chryseobacterium sp. TaxID=1871047 RepID=UPI0011CA8C4F|nr:hypothetical protein [Chryseobacterium sp.]TXF77753.1 hypothetical protein FUA25_07470 [Chryseobacterium sp.]
MKNTFSMLLLGLFSALALHSCKENEVDQLKKENEELKELKNLTRKDSMEIYNVIQNDGRRRFTVMFLDSLKKTDLKLYKVMLEEAESRNTLLGE